MSPEFAEFAPAQLPLTATCQLGSLTVRSNSWISNGFKSRSGSYPFAPVVQGSGVLPTEGHKFPIGKAAGRNESESRCSLVTALKMPTLGRSMGSGLDCLV